MQEGNPFAKSTVYITETHPLDAVVPPEFQAVSILADKSDFKARAKPVEIKSVLAGLPPDRIELFEIDYNSRLRDLPDLTRFSNLRFVHVGGRRIRTIGDLSRFERLESLYVANLKETRLPVLAVDALKNLRLIRGSIEHLDIPVSGLALLQSCSRLRTFGHVAIRYLILDSCRNVDLRSLAQLSEIMQLDLHGPSTLDDFESLPECTQLRSLTVTAARLSSARFDAFAGCASLRRAFLPLDGSKLKNLAAEYPRVVFGNGSVSFRGTQELPGAAWYNVALE